MNAARGGRTTSVSPRTLILSAAIVVVALLGVLLVDRLSFGDTAAPSNSGATGRPGAASTPRSGLPTVPVGTLPSQAIDVLALIDRGGPFPYKQDGTIFSNIEGHLPARPDGYYREYTVPTPGSPDRGTRRLIVGRDGDVYYTNDHYDSFRQVLR